MESKKRVTILTAVVALFVAVVRHGVRHNWGPWEEWAMLPVSWFIHWFALMFLAAVSGLLISRWHKFFLDTDPIEGDVRYQYYVSVVVLLVTIAVALLSLSPATDDM